MITRATMILLIVSGVVDAQPRKKQRENHVIAQARLYEVDEAIFKKVVKAPRLSRADLDAIEEKILRLPPNKRGIPSEPFVSLDKLKPMCTGKETKVDPGEKEGLLVWRKPIRLFPTPGQIQRGQIAPQSIDIGLSITARLSISSDYRFVRAEIIEDSIELEGREKVPAINPAGKEVVAELAHLKKATVSQSRDIPDGREVLIPLTHRPRSLRLKDRWLIARITTRIYIAEEENLRKKQRTKPQK